MLKRWIKLNKIFTVCIILIALFAWMDAKQITTFYHIDQEDKWELYNQYTAPAIISMWHLVLIAIGVIWYIFSKDLSEALAIIISTWIILSTGLQDVLFFMFSQQPFPDCMGWFGFPQNVVSKLMGECCVSPVALVINATLGIILAYNVFNWFKKQKW